MASRLVRTLPSLRCMRRGRDAPDRLRHPLRLPDQLRLPHPVPLPSTIRLRIIALELASLFSTSAIHRVRPAMASCRRLVRACSWARFATPLLQCPSPISRSFSSSSATHLFFSSATHLFFSSTSSPASSCGPAGAGFSARVRGSSTACGGGVATLEFGRGVGGHNNVTCIVFDRGVAMGRTLECFEDVRSPPGVVEDTTRVKPRRFAVLTTGRAADYCINTYGGYGPMFISMLSDPGEIWDEYFVVDGQFPSLEELQKYDGFVVTGSRHDAHANEEWIEKLCGLLQRIHEMKKKSLCVCFGHQVMSRALGGKTGRASVGWEVGLRDVCLTDAFFSKPYGAGMPSRLKVLQMHRDQVSEIPPGAELLGSSDRTGVEMFAVGDHILAIQGHPEFFHDVVVDLLEGRLVTMMRKDEIQTSKESLLKAADQKEWHQLCKDFLKGPKK